MGFGIRKFVFGQEGVGFIKNLGLGVEGWGFRDLGAFWGGFPNFQFRENFPQEGGKEGFWPQEEGPFKGLGAIQEKGRGALVYFPQRETFNTGGLKGFISGTS